jgi:hypothetical protein
MDTSTPRGWPERVRPPGADGWREQAVEQLLESCPPEFRGLPLLTRHPWVLAVFAARSVSGQQSVARAAVAEVRAELDGRVEPQVVQAAVDLWQSEAARLERVAREVTLLRQALAGDRFVPTMSGGWSARHLWMS